MPVIYNPSTGRYDYIPTTKTQAGALGVNPLSLDANSFGNNSLGLGNPGQVADNTLGQMASQPIIPGNNWMGYAGLAAMGAAPIAQMLLENRQAPTPNVDFAPGNSLGTKPVIGVPEIYRDARRSQPLLARLLMGGR